MVREGGEKEVCRKNFMWAQGPSVRLAEPVFYADSAVPSTAGQLFLRRSALTDAVGRPNSFAVVSY